jgi:UDP-N-acetylmuramate--alanine ligase
MSAVAKLLQHEGVSLSGSDAEDSEFTRELVKRGIRVFSGHAAEHLPEETDLLLYSSAVPESNPERIEARKRGVRELTNFQFLGEWTEERRVALVCGTHGKSTTTALLGLMLAEAGEDPTVLVGSRVPSFPDKNLRVGSSRLAVIEGDEYERHFLEFKPQLVILNNIELDHTDIYPSLEAMQEAFRELLARVRDGGIVIANADDRNVQTLVGEERGALETRGVRVTTFGFGSHADVQLLDHVVRDGEQMFALKDGDNVPVRCRLAVPGRMNVMNAAAAATAASKLGASPEVVREVIGAFTGIWRRFERVAESEDVLVVSDYGHHPTAVAATLEAARQFYPNRRLVLCFQPHHRNRTRHLFLDFVPSFDRADALILVEIYDVTGREAKEDAEVSSRDLADAVMRHDADRNMHRPLEFVPDAEEALSILKRWKKPDDLILVMGAGDIYRIAGKII